MSQNTPLLDRVVRAIAQRDQDLAECFENRFKATHSTMLESRGEKAALNHYWRHALGAIRSNTIEERSVLDDNMTDEQWILNFEGTVVQTIVRHRVK